MLKIRQKVYFSGRVQGVGFRWTTRNISEKYNITGFVRNLSDGRVELEAEGIQDEIDCFISDIQSAMNHYIRNSEITQINVLSNETGFIIKH